MQRLKVDDGVPIRPAGEPHHRAVAVARGRLQLDVRKHLLEYDDVLNSSATKSMSSATGSL